MNLAVRHFEFIVDIKSGSSCIVAKNPSCYQGGDRQSF